MSILPSWPHIWEASSTLSPWQAGAIRGIHDTNNRVYTTLSNIWEWDFLYEIHDCVDNIKTRIINFHLEIRNTVKNQEILDWLHEILYPLEAILSNIEITLLFLDELDHRLEDNRDDMVVELEKILLSELIWFEIWLLRLIRPDNRASMVSILARDLRIEIKKTRKALHSRNLVFSLTRTSLS